MDAANVIIIIGGRKLCVAAEGALLADLDGAAELGDAVKPYGVDVECGVVADGAAGGVRRVGVGGGDGPGVGVMKEEVAVGTEWVCEGVALAFISCEEQYFLTKPYQLKPNIAESFT